MRAARTWWNDPTGRKRGGNAGFTLLEVLIALYLLTFTVVTLGGFAVRFLTDSTDASHRSMARAYAVQQLEELRRRPYNELREAGPTVVPGADGFVRSTAVRRVGGPDRDRDFKIVTVAVHPPGGLEPVKLTTAISAP